MSSCCSASSSRLGSSIPAMLSDDQEQSPSTDQAIAGSWFRPQKPDPDGMQFPFFMGRGLM